MQAEIEVRFPNIDIGMLRKKLLAAGAICERSMYAMRRVIIDYPDRRLQTGQGQGWGFVRIRDDGQHVALAYKHVSNNRKNTHEIEFEVSSFENAIEFFEAIGLQKHGEQHTRRELWRLNDCEVTLDEWPWLQPMLEIEGPNKIAVHSVARKLGFDITDAVSGNAQNIYMQVYPGIGDHESISEIPLLTFEGEMSQWLKDRQ